ncbi:hypothetical protein CPB85DRAFT_296153 [Mucidula mucida]|nr:hypothetical protein CPB85DRAFT_296153 [Mucidula mucida]
MTDEAREGLDVNLVFAGLFSAVLTTFVAQTSQALQPDRATESTLLLREIAALQRAQMNGTSAESVPSTSADFTPAAIDVWVNGLWFTSLTLSLASALFAVLIKQWIRYYMSHTSGTIRKRSLIHQFRLRGFQKWHVQTLINILPVLMHLSLAIFFAGLTLFLLSLRRSIATIVGSASAFIFLAYIGTAIWPLFHVQCPYHSPLTNILYGLLVRLHMLQDRRKDAVLKDVAPAFEWLLSMSSNPSVHRVVVQAVGGCLQKSPAMTRLVEKSDAESIFKSTWADMFSESIYQLPDDKACIRPEKGIPLVSGSV